MKKLIQLCRKHYFAKMRGGQPSPARPNLSYILASWLSSMTALSVLYGVSYLTDSLLIMAPFGATCVLIFAAPESPLAQPRNVIGGHLISSVIALVLLNFLGDSWWVVALAMSTSIAAMQFTKTLHPPAGADPLVVIMTHASLSFIAVPVFAGAVILVICGVIKNNLSPGRQYPKYWW